MDHFEPKKYTASVVRSPVATAIVKVTSEGCDLAGAAIVPLLVNTAFAMTASICVISSPKSKKLTVFHSHVARRHQKSQAQKGL